jgi:hypothetical protein
MSSFNRKLDEALTILSEALQDGTTYLPWVSKGRVMMQKCHIKKLIYYGKNGYVGRDYGVKGPALGKFIGFAVTTEAEGAPTIITYEMAEYAEELSKHIVGPVHGFDGVYELSPDVANDQEIMAEVSSLSSFDLHDQEEILADVGHYYDRNDPDRAPVWGAFKQAEDEYDPAEAKYRDEEDDGLGSLIDDLDATSAVEHHDEFEDNDFGDEWMSDELTDDDLA